MCIYIYRNTYILIYSTGLCYCTWAAHFKNECPVASVQAKLERHQILYFSWAAGYHLSTETYDGIINICTPPCWASSWWVNWTLCLKKWWCTPLNLSCINMSCFLKNKNKTNNTHHLTDTHKPHNGTNGSDTSQSALFVTSFRQPAFCIELRNTNLALYLCAQASLFALIIKGLTCQHTENNKK